MKNDAENSTTDFWLSPFWRDRFSDRAEAWDKLFRWPGETVRKVKSRETVRIEASGRRFYIKRHGGVGWMEILKDLVRLKRPVVGARPEYESIGHMRTAGIRTLTPAGFGERGGNPARRQSFLITEELEGWIKLSRIHEHWAKLQQESLSSYRRSLIIEAAKTTRRMHEAGLNHRDYYLCHLLTPARDCAGIERSNPPELLVVDLHRMQRRSSVPRRWKQKDLAAVLFSAAHWEVSRKEILCFIRHYTGVRSAAAELRTNRRFWRTVLRKADRLYRRGGKGETLPLPQGKGRA